MDRRRFILSSAALPLLGVKRAPVEPVRHPVAVEDGVWTWFNGSRVVTHKGKQYIGSVSSQGDIQISELGGPTYLVTPLGQVDDHNNPALLSLPDGRLMAFYSRHNDRKGTRYRTNFESRESLIPGDYRVTYAYPFIANGEVIVFRRQMGERKEHQICRSKNLIDWTVEPAFHAPDHRPYVQASQDGERINFAVTAGHPHETRTGIYAFFMEGGRFYRSDGTRLPENFDVRTATKVTDPHGWVWQVKPGAILSTRYPSKDTHFNRIFGLDDIEYWLHQWDGREWVGTRIAGGQYSLYAGELYYAGGLCFGPGDKLYVSSNGQIIEWPSGQVIGNGIRPYYHEGNLFWVSGYYNNYQDYRTRILCDAVQA